MVVMKKTGGQPLLPLWNRDFYRGKTRGISYTTLYRQGLTTKVKIKQNKPNILTGSNVVL